MKGDSTLWDSGEGVSSQEMTKMGPTQCLEKSGIQGYLIELSAGNQDQGRNIALETGDPEGLEGVGMTAGKSI